MDQTYKDGDIILLTRGREMSKEVGLDPGHYYQVVDSENLRDMWGTPDGRIKVIPLEENHKNRLRNHMKPFWWVKVDDCELYQRNLFSLEV